MQQSDLQTLLWAPGAPMVLVPGWGQGLCLTGSLLLLLLSFAIINRRHKVRENYKTSLLKSNIKHFRLNMYNSLPSQGIIKLRVKVYTNNRGKIVYTWQIL